MITDILIFTAGLIAGGAVTFIFHNQIDADTALVIAAFKKEANKIKTAHTSTVVNKIIT